MKVGDRQRGNVQLGLPTMKTQGMLTPQCLASVCRGVTPLLGG